MPPRRLKVAFSLRLAGAVLDGDRAARLHRGDVEGERVGRADVRLPEPAEQDAQHRVGVGGGADRGAGVGAHPLLVDDDRRGQAVQHVDIGPRQVGHEALHEGAVGLVDHPLRLGGDRAEDQRALAGAGDAGEHGQPPLGDLDADVLEVVHPGAVHPDQVVAVGGVRRGRLAGRAHRVVASGRARRTQRSSWMRTMLPVGSRKAQSRTPHGWSVGSWTTSASLACELVEGGVEVVGGQGDAGVGALGDQLEDGPALLVGDAGVGGRWVQHDRGLGWPAARR